MIQLRRIKVKNFKCFSDEQDLELGRLTLLTGANSTGKSSLMYSVLGALQSPRFPFAYSANGRFVNMGNFSEIVFGHDKDREMEIGFSLTEKGFNIDIDTLWKNDEINDQPQLCKYEAHSPLFDLLIVPKTGDKNSEYYLTLDYRPPHSINLPERSRELVLANLYRIAEEYKSVHNGEDVSDKLRAGLEDRTIVKDTSLKIEGNSIYCYDDVQALVAYSQVSEIIRHRIEDYKSQMNFISSYRLKGERIYLEEDLDNGKIQASGKGFVNQLLHWRESNRENYEALVGAMRSMGLLYDIEPKRIGGGQFRVGVSVHKESPLASLNDVGFGISQLLPVVVGDIELGEGSTLFTAQPEIHLHPNAQANYADYMISQLVHGKNYVVETHSEYLLNRIRLAIVKGALKEEDVSIYYLSQEKDSTKVYPVQFTKSGQIIGAPKDFFETYMIDVMNIAMEAIG